MYQINDQKSDPDVGEMFDQKAYGISRTVCAVRQITTRAVNRHKGNQRQKGDECPNDLVSFKIVYKLFHNLLHFCFLAFQIFPRLRSG